MPDSLLMYAEWVELESFFSGYLLIYALIYLIPSNPRGINSVKNKLLSNTPLAYAFVATLYWGLQLKNMYQGGGIDHLTAGLPLSYWKIWGLLSILFWIPVLRKKAAFSLLHSLVFFFLLMKSLYIQVFNPSAGHDDTRNNMKIYTASILLNLAALILATIVSLLIERFKPQK